MPKNQHLKSLKGARVKVGRNPNVNPLTGKKDYFAPCVGQEGIIIFQGPHQALVKLDNRKEHVWAWLDTMKVLAAPTTRTKARSVTKRRQS